MANVKKVMCLLTFYENPIVCSNGLDYTLEVDWWCRLKKVTPLGNGHDAAMIFHNFPSKRTIWQAPFQPQILRNH